jgi:acetoin utilization deacetylase AcuC-like enzyme
MSFGLIVDPVFLEHRNPPGHPERPERMAALIRGCSGLPETIARIPPCPAEQEWLEKVHSRQHLERVRGGGAESIQALDPDTFTSARSEQVARLAAGGAIRLLQLIQSRQIRAGFSLARPPGHHASRDRAMGFCLLNHAAVAAEWALQERLARRVAILDFDVHHGNGTQEIFWSRSDVLYLSSHQYPHYPGTGALAEVGASRGEGYTVNFPVPAGHGDDFFVPLYRDLALPVLRQFKPDLIIVSAGYDACDGDPLGGMKMTDQGFGRITELLVSAAGELCQRRLLFLLEGGYHLEGLRKGVMATIEAGAGLRHFRPDDVTGSEEFEAYREKARAVLGRYWRI